MQKTETILDYLPGGTKSAISKDDYRSCCQNHRQPSRGPPGACHFSVTELVELGGKWRLTSSMLSPVIATRGPLEG